MAIFCGGGFLNLKFYFLHIIFMTFSRMLLCHQIISAWQGGLLCCFLWRDKSLCLGKGALELRKRGYYGFGFLSSPDIFPLNLIVVFFISIELYVLHLQFTVKVKERKKKTSAWQSALQRHLRKQISLFKKRCFVIFKMRTEVWKQGLFSPNIFFPTTGLM